MTILTTADAITFDEGGLVAELSHARVPFAHTGRMLLGKVHDTKCILIE